MSRFGSLLWACALVGAGAAPAWAQLAPVPPNAKSATDLGPAPTINVAGQLFTEFRSPTGNSAGTAAFDVTRAWVSPQVKFNDTWSAMTTLGVARGGAPAGAGVGLLNTQLTAMAQMAFLTATNLYPNSKIQFGLCLDPWNEFIVGHSGFMMYHSDPVFRQNLWPGYDFGVRDSGTFGPMFYHVGVFNGEGHRTAEMPTGGKGYEAIVGLNDLGVPGLTAALTGYRNHSELGMRDRGLAFLGYKVPGLALGAYAGVADDLGATTGNLESAYGQIGLGALGLPHVDLLLRADRFDPNVAVAGDGRFETLVGFQTHVAKYVTLGLTNQNTSPETGAASNAIVLNGAYFY